MWPNFIVFSLATTRFGLRVRVRVRVRVRGVILHSSVIDETVIIYTCAPHRG